MKRILLLLVLSSYLLPPLVAQEQASVRDLAPQYGIRPEFLDDTNNLIQYLEALGVPGDNHALTDTCVALNARLATFSLALQHDYRHKGDTLWLSPTTYATDYRRYSARISRLSAIALRRAYSYIQRETAVADSISQTALHQRLDSIRRNHNLIVSTCDGIGIRDKNRQKELKDIYYAYLSVYNRYDFSSYSSGRSQPDERYMQTLSDFQGFQEDLIHDLLSPDNIPAQIENFINTLRVRCGRNHLDVLRSYLRVARQTSTPVDFSSVIQYYDYIERLLDTRNWQQAYLTAINLRERMDSNSARIIELYSRKSFNSPAAYRKAADTYRDVEATISSIPTFSTSEGANTFLTNLTTFVDVIQQGYIDDYRRVDAIYNHGDSIIRACSMRYSDVAKAYRRLADTYVIVPTYRTVDETHRHGEAVRTFQMLQRQFDTILLLRRDIDAARDSIADGWSSHITVYNGYQNIRKQFSITPTFINASGASQYIRRLHDYREIQSHCLVAINRYLIFQGLDNEIDIFIKPYRNFQKAYKTMKDKYITVRTIVRPDDLYLYEEQHHNFERIQRAFLATLKKGDAAATDARLKGETDLRRIQLTLGLSD